jgi:methyltransferase-like protein
LLKAYGYNDDLVEFHVHPPRFVTQVSDRPIVSPVARLQAKDTRHVTNLRHESVKLDGLAYHLIPYLDGNWGREGLLQILKEWANEGIIEVRQGDELITEAAQIERALPNMLETALQGLANAALLVEEI